MYLGLPNLGLSGYRSKYAELEAQAQAAARRNGASLWYVGNNPSGFAFQASTGTTPATGTDPIGLLLDRQYGAGNLGPELCPNPGGPYTNTANWSSLVGTVAIVSGELEATSTVPGGLYVYQSFSTVVGATYQILVTARKGTYSAGDLQIGCAPDTSTSPAPISITSTLNSSKQGLYTATSTTTIVGIRYPTLQSLATSYIAALSVKQVLGFPALQSTAANKPTLELQANGYYGMRFDGVNDGLVASVIASSITAATSIAAATILSPGGSGAQLVNQRSATNAIIAQLDTAGTGNIRAAARNDAGILAIATSPLSSYVGVPLVASNRLSAGNMLLAINGVDVVSVSQATGATTPTATGIGFNAAAGSEFLNGRLSLICVSGNNMPDADRIAIERFAALLSGASYP